MTIARHLSNEEALEAVARDIDAVVREVEPEKLTIYPDNLRLLKGSPAEQQEFVDFSNALTRIVNEMARKHGYPPTDLKGMEHLSARELALYDRFLWRREKTGCTYDGDGKNPDVRLIPLGGHGRRALVGRVGEYRFRKVPRSSTSDPFFYLVETSSRGATTQ